MSRHEPNLSHLIVCVNLDAHGGVCGKPGHEDAPSGMCLEHAIAAWRAIEARMHIARRPS